MISELSRSILSFLIELRNHPNGPELGTMYGVDRSRRASHTSVTRKIAGHHNDIAIWVDG